jgi:hypothetical protein
MCTSNYAKKNAISVFNLFMNGSSHAVCTGQTHLNFTLNFGTPGPVSNQGQLGNFKPATNFVVEALCKH